MGKRSDKHSLSKDSGMFGLFKKREHPFGHLYRLG